MRMLKYFANYALARPDNCIGCTDRNFLQNLVDSMEEEIGATVSSSSSSDSSSSNFSNDDTGRVSYLSNVKSNITLLSGIFPLSSRITSSSSGSITTDRSKVCSREFTI